MELELIEIMVTKYLDGVRKSMLAVSSRNLLQMPSSDILCSAIVMQE